MPKNNTPNTPERIIKSMGEKAFFFHLEYPNATAESRAKMHRDFHSKTGALSRVWIWKIILKNIVKAVAKIRPTTAGRIPPSVAFTPA
jgi:hypothetical protein